MTQLRALGSSLVCTLCLCAPLLGQDADRIWGRVHLGSGDVHEGFIRWDRNEGSWVDILDGLKEVPEVNYLAWLEGTDGERAVRVIDLLGHRVSWEEEHPDFPREAASGIRFGHLASLERVGRSHVLVTVRSGEAFELEGASSDIGYGLRRVEVDVPGDDEVSVRWPEFDRIDFSSAPVGVRARSSRLYGTVEDEEGRRFEGYVAWDLDEILESDVLDGEEMQGGRDHEIPFARIASIVKIRRGARVVLKDGRTLDLTGTNDVDDDIRGVQVADPELGLVDLEWEAFRSVEFAPLPPAVGYEDFDGGRPLVGTVTTQSGEDLAGSIRWDADEGASWEFLNGWSDGVEFTIELRHVDRIERGEAFGAHVTLVDERSFELDDSNDVNWDNKGILVAPESADLDDASAWRLVSWDEFKQVELR